MSFSTGLSNLISDADQGNVLWRSLLQSLQDHGGTSDELDKLLVDTRGPRTLLDKLAQLMMGKIWELVENPISLDLSDNDFECSPAEFLRRYPTGGLHPGMSLRDGWYKESGPRDHCRYRLHHFPRPKLFVEVVGAFEPKSSESSLVEHAGWRELLAYIKRLKPEDLCGRLILSAGSPADTLFPVAHESNRNFNVGWKGVKRPETEFFGNECFWLVRVYE